MTIRYQCEECDSVLKIRDELAGTDGKCPKCKATFVISTAEEAQKASAVTDGGADLFEDPVDMPVETTPRPDFSTLTNFDPTGGSAPALPAIPATADDDTIKPSIAELMKDHEATRQKKRDKEDRKKGGLAEAARIAEDVTSGTAADALTRNYDQKRGKAGEPPPMTREERRDAEKRVALIAFAKKGGPAVAGIVVVLYFLFLWMFAEPVPDLGYVTGVVTFENQPLIDVEVRFAPALTPDSEEAEDGMRNSSSGTTDGEGRYVLMYNADNEGAVVGEHLVSIISSGGVTYTLHGPDQQKTVTLDDHEFNFDL